MRQRNRLYKLFLRTKIYTYYADYKRLRNTVQTNIRVARKRYYTLRFDSLNNSTQLWNELRRLGQLNSPSRDSLPVDPDT